VRRLATAAAVVVALVLGALALTGADGGGGDTREVRMVFDNAFGLVEGGDFRIGGVRAGQTTGFEVLSSKSGPPKAIVKATIDRSGPAAELRRDASCTIRPQSLVGEYFVDCQPGSSRERLTDKDVVPLRQTEGTIPQDLVNDVLRRPTRERLRLFVASLGTGLAGRPEDIQAVLRRSFPGLRETRKTLRILGDQNQTIKQFITDADTVVTRLEARRSDVTDFIRESRGAAETGASRRAELRDGVRRLPGFLAELKPTMAELSNLARQGTPLAGDLQQSAPAATTLLQRLGPFARSARPALRGLGEAAVPATQGLRESGGELAALRELARQAPGTVKPLRQTLQSLDDRRRAVDNDPRAALTAPPSPDPTSNASGRGFTGFESLVNYFFWQTMTTNGFDAIGHQLRVGATVSKCSPYRNEPPRNAADEQLFRDCNSWLGPHQPGINAPDPSVPGSAAAKARATKGDAPSTPKVELPPALKKLVERTGGNSRPIDPTAPAAPGAGSAPTPAGGAPQTTPSPTGLLDFLLKP
jgi:ABC-type transporter Mla subunit MlaD